jgi:hypothetical protein
MLTRRRLTGLVVFVFACLSWTGSVRAVPTAVTYWNDVAVAATATGRMGPVGLLDQAVIAAAVHDAVQAIEGRYEPYYFVSSGEEGSTTAAVAAATYRVLAGLYPSQLPGPTGLTQKYNDFVTANNLAGDPGLDVGADAAAALLTQYRAAPNPALPPYEGGTHPGDWRPALPAFATGAFEFAAYLQPFTLLRPSQFRPQPPPPLKSEQYRREYDEVKTLGSATGSTRTPDQTELAHFWSDNFVVQWPRALRVIVEAHVPDTGESARLFALAALSAADAFISCWDSKYHFSFWRPITAIREGENDTNPRTVGDPGWLPLIVTPPYPDYSSGANNLTRAYTKTLELFFDTDSFDFAVTSTAALAQQKTRQFHRFSDASLEVVEARILQGIHFRAADYEAFQQGGHVAHWVFQKFLRPVR